MKKFLSIILALAMTIALIPAVSAEGEAETRPAVLVNFARCEGLDNSYQYDKSSSKGAKDIDGTNFTTIDAETTTKTGSNTRNDNITAKENNMVYQINEKTVYFLMVMFDPTVWDGKVYTGTTGAPEINNLGRWTIEIDMGSTVPGWYELVIRGANNYIGGIFDVYADREYIGEYNCRKLCKLTGGDHITSDFGKVYLSPDENGKVKLAFVLKEYAYTSEADETPNTTDTRLLIENISFTPTEAPENATAKTVSTKLSWNTMYYFGVDSTQETATYAVPSNTWVTSGFELVLDDGKMTTTTCRYTPQTIDKTEYFTQLRTGNGLWPSNSNAMFTIKRKVAAAGWYRVDVQGVLNIDASDFAIYVNGEYAGDYNFDNTESNSNKLGEKKQLNTVWINAGENEISFRARTKNYASNATFIPYIVDLVPASEPTVASVETTAVETSLEIGEEKSFTANVKMTDNTYRSFGYNNDGSIPAIDDVVSVVSSDENVVKVVECVNVEAVDVADISATVDPETVNYTIKAVGSGTADITVNATVNGETMSAETVTITVPTIAEKPETEKAPTVSFYAESSVDDCPIEITATDVDNNAVEAAKLASLNRGANVTVTAPEKEGYLFVGWFRGSKDTGRFVWADSEYSFNAMTHTMLTAVYEEIPEKAYYNFNGEFLGTSEPSSNPTMLGYEFNGWNETVYNNLTRLVANYSKDKEKTYNVALPSEVSVEKDEDAYYYDTKVTLTSDSAVTWLRNEKPVAYGKTYTFYVWDDVTITTDTTADTAPKVILDSSKSGEYMIEYDAGNKTIIEKGIIFGTDDDITIDSCDEKMNSQRSDAHGQFTASSDYRTARGYLIYEDDGDYKVIYAE